MHMASWRGRAAGESMGSHSRHCRCSGPRSHDREHQRHRTASRTQASWSREHRAGDMSAMTANAGGATEAGLEVSGITKVFPGTRALDAVDLHVQDGRGVALVGENGAGKSTLMNVLSGVHKADSGVMHLDGKVY